MAWIGMAVPRRKKHGESVFMATYFRHGGRCVYCSRDVYRAPWYFGAGNDQYAELDHWVALSRGGPDHPDNLVLACARCNARKGTKNGLQFMAQLARERGAA